jgi:hypothetical protein
MRRLGKFTVPHCNIRAGATEAGAPSMEAWVLSDPGPVDVPSDTGLKIVVVGHGLRLAAFFANRTRDHRRSFQSRALTSGIEQVIGSPTPRSVPLAATHI